VNGKLRIYSNRTKTKNIIISGTNFWNPGDDFVRDGIIRILRKLFKEHTLNFLFYNFNQDFYPQSKFSGIHNMAAVGDLDKYHEFVDAVVIAGLSAGKKIKDLYNWVIANGLEDRVYLIGAGYENSYVDKYIYEEPEATIFKKARVITGKTKKTPALIPELGLPYYHINCPAILSVENVKDVPVDRKIERIGFSIQIPHEMGIVNQATGDVMYQLATNILLNLSSKYTVEVVAHHKTEYFHFLHLLKNHDIPVIFSSFYQDLFDIYPRYDLVISTRLHACIFANGFGIPAFIINETSRHTHTSEGFPHSICINNMSKFNEEFEKICMRNLRQIAQEAREFKNKLMQRYLNVLAEPFGVDTASLGSQSKAIKQKQYQANCRPDAEDSKLTIHVPADYQFDSEINEQKLVRNIVKEGMTVVDVGAHLGKYTKLFSLLTGDKGRVYAFEPAESSFKKLASSMKELNCTNVTLINKAIYSQNGKVVLHEFPEEFSAWNSLGWPKMENPEEPTRLVPIEKSSEVDAMTLDSFCKEHNIDKIDCLKLDIEGAELEALIGTSNLLENKAICYLQFEISEKMLQGLNTKAKFIFDFLKSKGYECHTINEDGEIGDVALDSDSFYENYIAFPSKITSDKLNIGCGSDYRQGFVNIDVNPDLSKVDYVLDIKPGVLLEHFEPGSFNYILAKDFLEHHFHWEAHRILEDFYALLNDEGQLDIRIPNIETIINNPSKDITEKVAFLYGGQDIQQRWETSGPNLSRQRYPQYFCHKYGWTPDSIKSELLSVGFSPVEVTEEGWNMRVVAKKRTKTSVHVEERLPVHFFTIVLNGQPFIRHHIEVFKQLPFKWHWHIIEGVAELKHDTAWSVKLGGRINEQLHRNGLSNDGTTEYIDEIVKQFPNNITVYRKADGAFWDGKLEMVNAPLANINEECLLWQVDSDELWTAEQIHTSRDMFIAEPDRTVAYYLDHFFVGENLVTTTINTYGNNTSYEWLRTWRFSPGFQWKSHEPPRLCMPAQEGKWVDIATIKHFKHHETMAKKLVFQHYAYATEKQLVFKEIYYGYKNAVEQWRHLQRHKDFPVFLRDYFAWVKDGAQVNTIWSQNITPIARKDANDQWQFSSNKTFSEQQSIPTLSSYKKVLIVKTDSIGDFVIFAGMLKHFRALYPNANISIVMREHIAELAETCPYINKVIKINATTMLNDKNYVATLVDYMKQQRFDVTLYPVYSRDKIGEFIAINSGAKENIAFWGDSSNLSLQIRQDNNRFYTKLLPSEGEYKPELERNKDFLRGLGIESPSLAPKVWITDKDKKFAEEFFTNNNLKPESTIVIFAGVQYNVRLYEKYGESLSEFCKRNRLKVIGLGAKQEWGINQMDLDAIGVETVNLSGSTTIRQSAAIIKQCRLAVGAETGLAHISCAVGTPNVVLLGGGHFGRFMPYSKLTSVACLPLDCYGCNWKCRYEYPHCIRDVKPEIITQAVQQTFEKRSEKPRVFLQGSSFWETKPGQPSWKPANGFLNVSNVEIITVERFENTKDEENKYLVTAIVSTYNSERFIRDCLEDLEKQSIADRLEIIVVDSGSQQNEEAIVREFQQKYDNIKYIKTEKRETIYKAWNRAIKIASGKYITNANTDDRHRQDALEKMARTLDENPDKVLVYANQLEVNEIGGHRVTVGERINGQFSRSRLFDGECPPGSQPMWRKDVHELFGYFDESFIISGDYEFWFRLTQKFDFFHLNETLGECFIGPDAVSRSDDNLLSWENEMVIRKCYEYALQEGMTIGATGISEHPVFSRWPEVNIWKQNTKAKLENRRVSLVDNIKDTWDFRKNPSPKLTIVIVTYNRHKELLENLYSLNEQKEKDFEVIVMDNGGDLSWLKQHINEFSFGLCGIELELNFGPSPARNIGIEFAKAKYAAFLDDDAVADNNLVRKIVEHFENYNISGLRGKVLPKTQTDLQSIPVNYDLGDQIINTACEVSSLSAFRKDVLVEMRGFDELLFGSEGMDLSYRICKAQKEKVKSILYFPDVIVYHDHRPEGPAQTEKTLRQHWMELLAWRKDNNITGYKELVQSLYPGCKAILEDNYKNYPRLINVALYLHKNFPEEAIQWAEKAVALRPDGFKGCYVLGSLYTWFGRYDEALALLERIFEPLRSSVMSGGNEFISSEFEEQVDIRECYVSVCTQLAQCYIQTNQYHKLKQVYTDLLNNPHLTLAEKQRADILNVLTKLDRATPPLLIAERKNTTVVSAEPEQNYLVSAIVSTYNSEKFLRGCLDDLEQQTIADKLEVIVINSGSQENEEAIVHEYQQKHSNIVYIKTEKREGIYTAWNRAVKVARGTFLTNANTDDRHREDALEIMAKSLLANPNIALVYGDQIRTDTPNGTFDNHHAIEMTKRPEYSRERLLFGCCVGSQPMWRKSIHNELGYFDETSTCAGDWDFWLRISSKYKFKHIPEFLGLYYHNEDGIEHGKKIHSLYERYIVGRRYGNPYISVIPLYTSKDNPLVSVIMPAYNAAEHIAEAIESVLIQNYRNFELIVVDDGSTDNTRNTIAGFKDYKVRYFHKENAGPASARNLGITKSQGLFLIHLDSDDLITPDYIAKHLQEFEEHPDADLVYCDDCLIDENSKPIRVIERPEYTDRKLLIRDLFRCGFPVVPFRTCIRKSVFDKIGFFDEELLVAEDYDMMRRLVKHGLKIHHLKGALYLRRMTSDSLSRNYSAQKAKSHFDVIKRFIDTFAYYELFPDVAWDEIAPQMRQLHAKCLTAGTYLAIGQDYVKTKAMEYSRAAFDRACSELNDCVKIAPENQSLRQLLQKSKLIRARYAEPPQQVVSK